MAGLAWLVKSLIIKYLFTSSPTAQALQWHGGRANQLPKRAQRGFALIDLIFVCGIIGLLCSIALPRLLLARQSAGTASTIASMRVINSAQLTYALTCGSGFYAPNLTTLGTPPPGSREAFISVVLGSTDTVERAGYIIQMSAVP